MEEAVGTPSFYTLEKMWHVGCGNDDLSKQC